MECGAFHASPKDKDKGLYGLYDLRGKAKASQDSKSEMCQKFPVCCLVTQSSDWLAGRQKQRHRGTPRGGDLSEAWTSEGDDRIGLAEVSCDTEREGLLLVEGNQSEGGFSRGLCQP